MSYDPIHDTYTASTSSQQQQQQQQHQQSSPPPSKSTHLHVTGSSPPSINQLISPNIEPSRSDVNQHQNQFTDQEQATPSLILPQPDEPKSTVNTLGGGALSISNLVSSSANEAPSLSAIPPITSTHTSLQKMNSISSLINSPPDHNDDTGDDDYDETDVNSSVVGDDEDYVATPPPQQQHSSTTTPGKSHKSSPSKKKKKNNIANAKLSLKRADGEAFWRRDIQYDFLKELFDDKTACFTNTFSESNIANCNNNLKITFGELYIRTLAESNKSSRVLKEKLIRDVELGKAVAKVCILVNVGRMNTTINFVPEMKSTLRTYHSIPSLQTCREGGTVKQLQDTPRLKSILKAVCEGEENNLNFLDDMIKNPPNKKPNTNVIQLLFLLSNAVHGVPFLTDQKNSYLLDFFVNTKIHPANRAKRLLWLLYTLLETNFTETDLHNNPFGADSIPSIQWLDDSEMKKFDIDPDYERYYAEEMFKARMQYLANPDDEQYKEHSRRSHGYGHLKKRDAEDHDDTSGGEEVDDRKKKSVPLKKKLKRNNPNKPSPLSKNVITFHDKRNRDIKSGDILNFDLEDSIHFPVKDLKELASRYKSSDIMNQSPNELESVRHRRDIVELSKPMVQEVRTSSKASTASFNKKITILGNWLYRYFKYKKSIGNRLVGIEWEDIRYDLVHGVESYLYEKFGKSLILDKMLSTHYTGAEGTNGSDKNGVVANGGNTTGRFEEEENEVYFDYVPLRDYDKANEKQSFILHLISFVNDWFILRLRKNASLTQVNRILIDLDNETVHM